VKKDDRCGADILEPRQKENLSLESNKNVCNVGI